MTGLDWFLGINGIAFLIVGLRAVFTPIESVAEPLGLEVRSVDGRNYLRSGTGGVSTAGGIVLVAAMFIPKLQLPAVILVVTMLGGLVAGRIYSLVVDGAPGAIPWVSGFFELLGFVFGVLWLIALWEL
ncbi:MAG TPA: DUF4345 domain-containing protein [Nevskiaceae bacterium]|nr:DUF4345 domain-containing protein [Nevskiaceae bacterium]